MVWGSGSCRHRRDVRTALFADPSDALGERLRRGDDEYARIVGVVGSVRQEGLDREARAHLYLLHSRHPNREMTVVLRTRLEPLGLADAVRQEVRALDPNLPLFNVTTAERTMAESMASERFGMLLQIVFTGVALVLAVVGIYGVLSYAVAQRTSEIGIRMAHGAGRGSILGMVVRQGMTLVLVDPAASHLGWLAAAMPGLGVLLLLGAAACGAPLARALRIPPNEALRNG